MEKEKDIETEKKLKQISKNIKIIRLKNNLTQGQLAELIKVSQKDISRWENGSRTPSLIYIIKLSEALNCKANDIIY